MVFIELQKIIYNFLRIHALIFLLIKCSKLKLIFIYNSIIKYKRWKTIIALKIYKKIQKIIF